MKLHVCLLALRLLIVSAPLTAQTSQTQPSTAPEQTAMAVAGNAAAGKATFTQYCSICHGVGARGFIGPNIAGINWTTPGLHAIVRGGIGGYGGMPAFNADAVTDRNIADIAAYLATLPPAVAHQPQRRAQATGPTGTATSPSRSTIASASSATATSSAVGAPLIPTDPNRGRQIYAANCAACHGADARGGIGPTLRGEKSRKDTAAAIVWIKNPLPPMPKLYPSVLSEKDVEDVAAYVESL